LKASVIAWSVETVGIGSVKVTPVWAVALPAWWQGSLRQSSISRTAAGKARSGFGD